MCWKSCLTTPFTSHLIARFCGSGTNCAGVMSGPVGWNLSQPFCITQSMPTIGLSSIQSRADRSFAGV